MQHPKAPISKDTLRQILSEIPSFYWSDDELNELVSPKHGVITAFQGILEDIGKLAEIDLESIEPAGQVMGKSKYYGK